MKHAKPFLTAALALLMLLSLTRPALADNSSSPTTISTLDELQEAIEAAHNGDTIIFTDTIRIDDAQTISANGKSLTLVSGAGQACFETQSTGQLELQGFTFDANCSAYPIFCFGDIVCKDCIFYRCSCGVWFMSGSGQFTNCTFLSCYEPIRNAIGLKMANCTVTDCLGQFCCIAASGNIEITNCHFANNFSTVLQIVSTEEATRIENSIFRNNRSIMGSAAAICTWGDLALSGCAFLDNSAGFEGDDICILNSHLYIIDNAQALTELYSLQGYEYDGIYTDFTTARHGDQISIPFDSDIENLALSFSSTKRTETPEIHTTTITEYVPVEVEKIIEVPVEVEKIVEVPTPSDPIRVIEYVPVYRTETVEVERIIEIETTKEVAELNGVTIERNDDYLTGYFNALKGKDATRADVAQILYKLAKHGEDEINADYGYTDIPRSAPYAEAVNALSNAGIFQGCGNGLFAPNATMSNAQVIVVISRLLDIAPMDDIAGHWAMPYLVAAQEQGIAADITISELDKPISMEELQIMIDNLFLKSK